MNNILYSLMSYSGSMWTLKLSLVLGFGVRGSMVRGSIRGSVRKGDRTDLKYDKSSRFVTVEIFLDCALNKRLSGALARWRRHDSSGRH
jgi:hypothetical protein